MFDRSTVLMALTSALLLGGIATAASGAPIDPATTPAYAQAQLAYQQLSLYAPVDTTAGSPFFAPIDAGLVVTTPAPVTLGGSAMTMPITTTLSGTVHNVDMDRPSEAIPEPAGALLFAAGFAFVALRTRRS